ncbi:MAG: nucleotide-binding protein [Archangium sp.]|nr:nucleotide-binding protein [Archangium sp.]
MVLLGRIDSAKSHCKQAGVLVSLARRFDSYVRKKELVRGMTHTNSRDSKTVFIIYGRNTQASTEVEKFLLAVGLRPLTFQEARRKAGTQPSVFEIVKFGVSTAQAVIALFTPDEWSALDPTFIYPHDRDSERARWQARPNVPFEAGLAMGLNQGGTILVTLGAVELPSDISGLHQFRLSNEPSHRHEFRRLLKQLGCPVDEDGTHFLDAAKAGDFSAPKARATRDPFG